MSSTWSPTLNMFNNPLPATHLQLSSSQRANITTRDQHSVLEMLDSQTQLRSSLLPDEFGQEVLESVTTLDQLGSVGWNVNTRFQLLSLLLVSVKHVREGGVMGTT